MTTTSASTPDTAVAPGRAGEAASRPWTVVAALLVVVAALLLGPRPLALPARHTGDAGLAARVRSALGPNPGTHAVAVAVTGPDGMRTAGLGTLHGRGAPVDADTPFEIGSATKPLTAMVLADMADDGAVRLDARIGDVARTTPLAGTAAGSVTLQEYAQHRSGMPRLAWGGPAQIVRQVAAPVIGRNPYAGWSPEQILAEAGGHDVDGRGDHSYSYSNFGFAVLGDALASAADTGYADLLRRRLLDPVGMTSTTVVTQGASVPSGHAWGTTVAGLGQDPWTGVGYAPAGVGVWSTAADMGRLVQGAMTGAAPGADATRPRRDIGDGRRIGLAWMTERIDGRVITWHNGGTGGFSSWIGFDRAARRAVVVLSASDRSIDDLGEYLLGAGPPPASRGWRYPGPLGLVVPVALLLVVGSAVRAARGARRDGLADRLALAAAMSDPVVLLAIAWVLGAWSELPWWLWSAAAAVWALCGVSAAAATRGQPFVADGAPLRRIVGNVAQVGLTVAVVALLLA